MGSIGTLSWGPQWHFFRYANPMSDYSKRVRNFFVCALRFFSSSALRFCAREMRLTVNGQKFTQPLTVVPDPRVNLPANAYIEQFTLAREVEQTRAAVAAALTDAAAFVKRTDVPDALRRKATEVSGTIAGDDFTAPPPQESSLRFIGQALSKLAGAIDSADAAPTPDARTSWATLKPAADAALAAWTAVKGEAK